MYDQLIVGESCYDIPYLYGILKNEGNIEYFIQQSSLFPNVINLLFRCLKHLDGCETSRHIVSNILCLIYTHCSERLTIETKRFISNYTSMSEDELNDHLINARSIYFSEGAKRQKLDPTLHNNAENNEQHSHAENQNHKRPNVMIGNAVSSAAKRQRGRLPVRTCVREVQMENGHEVKHFGKRVRLSN